MAVKRNYRINLRNYGNPPAVMVSQYDENYSLTFEVYEGPLPASGLNTYTVKLVGTRADTLKYSFDGTVTGVANNVLNFTIDTTMTACAGKGVAEIVILDATNDVKFASFNLPVYVEKAAVPDDAIDADVERAQEIADQVEELIDGATEGAEAWAVGQRGGVDVESTDPTYHNNAKYYSEVAQDIADSIGIDTTLSVAGKAADAKKTGDEISSLKEDLNDISFNVITDDLRTALLQLASKVAFIDDDGQDYYDDIYDALYPPASSISAVYTPTSEVIAGQSVDTLKTDLVVTATFSGNRTKVLSDDAYTLSGTLVTGSNTVTVTYRSSTTTFTVLVGAAIELDQSDMYNKYLLDNSYQNATDGYYKVYATRMSYPHFDIPVEGGKTYRVTVDWIRDYDLYLNLYTYGIDILTLVANHSDITIAKDNGFKRLSEVNGVVDITPPYDSVMRLAFKIGSGGSTQFVTGTTYINSITIAVVA